MKHNQMNYNVTNQRNELLNEILFLIIIGVVIQNNWLGCYCLTWQ